jgi:MATE family multidrug resistance protein
MIKNVRRSRVYYTYAPEAKHMGQLWHLAWPLIISNISVPLLGLADAAIMGHLDEASYLGAVALGATLLSFIYWAFGFLRMGTVGLTAQAHGAKDNQRLMQLLLMPGLFALAIGLAIMALQSWLIPLGVSLMGASAQVSTLAQEYLSIRIYSAPAVLITYVCLGWLLGRQDSRSPLLLLVVTNVSNIGFNLVFVIGYDMTSAGVAWGSLLADYCGLLLALVLVWRHITQINHKLQLQWSTFAPLANQLMRLNSYLFVRTLMLLFAFAFITSQSARMGDDVLAANTLLLQYVTLLAYALDGFAFAIEAACGEALGAKQKRRFYQLCNGAAIYSVMVAVAATFGFWLLSDAFINMLTTIESVRQLASEHAIWVMWVPIISVWSYLFDGIFVGATQPQAMFYSVLASLGGLLPLWYLLEPWGNDGLWWAFLGFCGIRALVALAGYLWLSHKQAWLIST